MSTRHQAKRRRLYGPRRHEVLERRPREPETIRPGRDEPAVDDGVEVAVAFLALGLPAPRSTMGD